MVTQIMVYDHVNSQAPLRRTCSHNVLKNKVIEQLVLEQDLLCEPCCEM